MQRSQKIAIGLLALVVLWLASGLLRFEETVNNNKSYKSLTRVKVEKSVAQNHQVFLLARGFTEADRVVEIKAEVEGRVMGIFAEEGTWVKKGQKLLELNLRDREAKLAEAQAMMKQKKLEFDAAKKLHAKSFRSSTGLALAEAEFNEAEAQLAGILREIEDTKIKAPFDGIIEKRDVEIGTFVKEGDRMCTVVDLDPLLAIINVSELEIPNVTMGQSARVRLTQGEDLQGKVSFISRVADRKTRSFRVEISIPNPGYKIPEGLSLEVGLPINEAEAHGLSPALLSLNTEGQIGVKVLDKEDRVKFIPVRIVDSASDGVWVVGLPKEVQLIVTGQEFVSEKEKVQPVRETIDDGTD